MRPAKLLIGRWAYCFGLYQDHAFLLTRWSPSLANWVLTVLSRAVFCPIIIPPSLIPKPGEPS